MKTYKELRKYIGQDFQVFGVRESRLVGGKQDNVRIVDAKSGGGLEFTVVPSKGMDIADFSYKGINMSYLAKIGYVNPYFHVEDGRDGFDRTFMGGILTTCGFTHMGAPCVDDGRKLGLHGPLPNTPADDVVARVEYDQGDEPVIVCKGRMKQGQLTAEYIVSEREIRCKYGENKITITDRVMNRGYTKEPLMMLYHFNFGYPLLSEDTQLVLAEKEYEPRDEDTAKGKDRRFLFEAPGDGRPEECHFYKLRSEADGKTAVLVKNEKLGLAVVVRMNTEQVGYMTEWKCMYAGDYALGVNPGTYTPMGRVHAKEHGLLQYIEPEEVRPFDFELEVLDSKEKIAEMEKYITSL
ncbi:aldose 1-epimerase family protein [Christensenellaceae bacterium OttesenSCG-928-K19]|nr:aldose 1-epimerase family protein [Christensenellaceae bacterium OttesenSCG-928-K19]